MARSGGSCIWKRYRRPSPIRRFFSNSRQVTLDCLYVTYAMVQPHTQKGVVVKDAWTVAALEDELKRFETELRAAGLKPNSVETYVERTSRFIRWLAGDYKPRGPVA